MPDTSLSPILRKAAIGYTALIGGICGLQKYSIIEFSGFNQIQNAAHELAHRYNLYRKIIYIYLKTKIIQPRCDS